MTTTPGEASDHDYEHCTDPDCADELCGYYRAGRAAGYDAGFMRGAAAGHKRGRARALGLDDPDDST